MSQNVRVAAVPILILMLCVQSVADTETQAFFSRSTGSEAAFAWNGHPIQIALRGDGPYVVGGPVSVQVALKNSGTASVTVRDLSGYFVFRVRDSSGKALPPKYIGIGSSSDGNDFLTLVPGSVYTETFNVAIDYDFTKPGRYEITVVRNSPIENDIGSQAPLSAKTFVTIE